MAQVVGQADARVSESIGTLSSRVSSRREAASHLDRYDIEEPPVMSALAADQMRATVDDIYQSESRRVFATLIRLLGDFDLAEDALQDAFAAALRQWPQEGIPANPRAWLVSTGRFKAIDSIRRRARFDKSLPVLAEQMDDSTSFDDEIDDEGIEDDRLRLIFTCCHPGAGARCPRRADAARGLRTHDRGDRPRISGRTLYPGPAHRARQGQDS